MAKCLNYLKMADIKIKWLDRTDSTNTQVAALKESLADMSTVAADCQTAGRGQRGNQWESRPGENLTFSILFKPNDIQTHEQFCISQVSALGIVDYLAAEGIQAKVKWPNDIYVGDKKICGILIENSSHGDKLSASIVGIGFNLNQTKFESDAPNPTSLALLTGRRYDTREELPKLLSCIFSLYLQVNEGEKRFYLRTSLDGRYLESMYRRGEWHGFEETPQGRTFRARILGIDNSACLLLEHADGSIRSYAFKEIRYIL